MNDAFDRAVWREKLERQERRTRHMTAGFRFHAMLFVVVNAGLLLLWLAEDVAGDGSWRDLWFVPIFVIWGLVLAVHGWSVRAHAQLGAELRARLDDPRGGGA